MEIEEDSHRFTNLSAHCHRGQVDIVAVLRRPRRVIVHHFDEASIEVEEPHVEVLYHFGLFASCLFLGPVSRKVVLRLDRFWRPSFIIISLSLIVM